MSQKISIQGQTGSFHDIAQQAYFKNGHELLSRKTFKEVFADVKNSQAEFGLVAIENSLYGSINEVYDLLLKEKLWISGEVYMRINHCLIGLAGTELSKIQEVHSQLPALGQCEDYLDKHLPHAERIEQHDTAGSVASVAQIQDPTKAAIGSKQAAQIYNLEILAEDIETHKQNYTRFVVLQKNQSKDPSANKTSLVLSTLADTKPGALHRALGIFAEHNINLTMLQSRPIIGRAWHYLFYVDFDAGIQDSRTQQALNQLDKTDHEISILGSYKSGTIVQ